jgi:hypothetical protein
MEGEHCAQNQISIRLSVYQRANCCHRRLKRFFEMYVLSVIYLQPLNPKSTASGASGASLASGASQESLESGASGPSEGENGRLKIDVTENVRSLLHFRTGGPAPTCRGVHNPRWSRHNASVLLSFFFFCKFFIQHFFHSFVYVHKVSNNLKKSQRKLLCKLCVLPVVT